MKKFLLSVAVLIAGTTLAFAANFNAEFDFSYIMGTRDINIVDGNVISEKSPVGFNGNAAWYYLSPNQYVDLGLAANFGLDAFNYISNSDYEYNCKGIDLSAGLAPVFRFNFGTYTSLYVAPGFLLDKMTITIQPSKILITTLSFELDLGYRGWFITNSNYSMGVCAGYKLGVPFLGSASTVPSSSDTYSILGNTSNKLYLGLCMNFGTKSDAKRATFRKVN